MDASPNMSLVLVLTIPIQQLQLDSQFFRFFLSELWYGICHDNTHLQTAHIQSFISLKIETPKPR